MRHLGARNGLGEFFTSIFTTRTLKGVTQVRTPIDDKQTTDLSNVKGVDVDLRTVQFNGIPDIQTKLDELERKGLQHPNYSRLISGVIWGKYGLWVSERLSEEDNLMRGQWLIFGTWPADLKCILREIAG
jgi:hypothetical protein